MKMFHDFIFRNNDGATAIEYAIIASLVAIIAIPGLWAFGQSGTEMFNYISQSMTGATS